MNKSRLLDLAFGRRFSWVDLIGWAGTSVLFALGGKWMIVAFPWLILWLEIGYRGEQALAERRRRVLRWYGEQEMSEITPLLAKRPWWKR